ncbi:hypothetical protein [Ochrobactrum quorumnocens]|uniref:hypothetical protein n=1 Tax=Ochrobactrum quorumnocens TaxID=271865 RepID=UPI000BA86D40|nr:hypothetical protein [[Ochrobactrum] quorumnocens]
MKIVEKNGLGNVVDVYGLYWVDGIRHHLIIPYIGYDGFVVVTETNCDVVEPDVDDFVLRKGDYGRDILLHWAVAKDDLVYRLTDPPDADAVTELRRRIEHGR